MRFLHVVDRPEDLNHGITAFARTLAEASEQMGASSHVVNPRHSWSMHGVDHCKQQSVILHYEPGCMSDGFQRRIFNRLRVSPAFLLLAMRIRAARLGFVAIVHEAPWPRRSGVGVQLNRRLDLLGLRAAGRMFTASEQVAKHLASVCRVPCEVRPVFSNLPDPAGEDLAELKENIVVLFGSTISVDRFVASAEWWRRALRELPSRALCVVTPALSPQREKVLRAALPEWRVECHLGLDASGVSAVLSRARYGVIDYAQAANPPDCFGKSGVLAAYLQHGVWPLIRGEGHRMFSLDNQVSGGGRWANKAWDGATLPASVLQARYTATRSLVEYAKSLLFMKDCINGKVV
jgi:hypothetical protein